MKTERTIDDALIGNGDGAVRVDTTERVSWRLSRFEPVRRRPGPELHLVQTHDVIGRELMCDGRIMRYTTADDLGLPETAFPVCGFRDVDALAQIGRHDEAPERSPDILPCPGAFGSLSEDLDAVTGQLWDHGPQTCSMAGIIKTAMRLSQSWEDAWCQDL